LEEPGFAVLEIKTDRSENLAMHRQYWQGAVDIVSVVDQE
jgi:2-succinyl-5-enolpyruvyl-6-hydroxy-3-cyclohexene-1-carboxylate synthase